MPTTFEQFCKSVRERVFPEGEADNLIGVHNTVIQEGLLDLQLKLEDLQDNQSKVVTQDGAFFECGASVFPAPDGVIDSLYTTLVNSACDRVDYTYVDHGQMQMLMKTQKSTCSTSDAYGMTISNEDPENVSGYPVGSQDVDKGYRSSLGFWSLNKGLVYVFPSLESSEQAVVKWTGINREWSSADELPDAYLKGDVKRACSLWLESESARTETRDREAYKDASEEYKDHVADMIVTVRKKTRPIPQKTPFIDTCKQFKTRTTGSDTNTTYPVRFDISIFKGVTFSPITITVDSDSGPMDLTGYTAYAQARLVTNQSTVINLAPVVTDGPAGQITLDSFTHTETSALTAGVYEWDLLIMSPTSVSIGPIIKGKLYVVSLNTVIP